MNRKLLIEQILNDAKEGYLTEGKVKSKHAPGWYRTWEKPSGDLKYQRSRNAWHTPDHLKYIADAFIDAFNTWSDRVIRGHKMENRHKVPQLLLDDPYQNELFDLADKIYNNIDEYSPMFKRAPKPNEILAAVKQVLAGQINVEINFGGMKNALQYKYPGRDGLIMKKEMHKLYKSEQFKNALEKIYKENYRDVVGSWDQIKSVFDRKPKTGNKLSEV